MVDRASRGRARAAREGRDPTTGYQDEESPGAALLKLVANEGPRQLKLGDQMVDVRCRFSSYSLSAHADRMQMVGLIEALSPSTVVLVHGDRAAKEALVSSLGVDDIQLAADGDEIATYNKARPAAARPRTAPLSAKAASALIGLDAGKPLAAASLAEAWLGHAVTPDELARFVEALIELGVARRDDADPALLWSLVPAPEAILDEASAEARALKADNPKGRLLELCARRRLATPEVIHTESGEANAVEIGLDTPEGSVTSGVVRASSKSLAEQMAVDCCSKPFAAARRRRGP